MEDSILDLKEKVILLNNKIREYEVNTIPTLKHNIDVLVDSEDRLNNIINELEKWIKENNLGKYRTENVVNTDELLDKLKALKDGDKND